MTSQNTKRGMVVATAAVTALTASLTACSSPGGESGGAGEIDGSTITIATIAQLKDQFQVYADAYTEKYPDRTVKIQATTTDPTEYVQQLATQRLSGTMPDIFFNVDFLANSLAADDVALDLAPALSEHVAGLDLDSFLPQFVGQYRPLNDPDAITGLPVSADSTALVYNKTLFDEAGVTEYPQADWTWDDYARVAAEIQKKSGGKISGTVNPLGASADSANLVGYSPILAAYGVKLYDAETNTTQIGSADAVKAWTMMMDLYGTGAAPFSTTANDPSGLFESGKVAMAISSRGSIATYRDALADYDWDVTETPTVNGAHISGGGSYGLSVGTASKNQDAALAFLGWFFNADEGLAVAQTAEGGGIIPPTAAGLASGTWQDVEVPKNMSVFAETAKDAVLQAQLPGSTTAVLNTALATAIQEVLLNGADPAAAFKTAEDTVNAALAAEQD